ncbi:oligopeptide/dipeptide ABC transporter, ATP-binding protein, C-terminal domain-containing protein [Amycolatopsis tolypomycina]|uniref:Oligopeptide/dipeptide ABC transporter, ATP-binding protein, C-terminal domain-containing protein n=1 Tax=Amycolatopsis tolypomycina TaxID=208445 RepID=A0A1H4ZAZ8_9PSEU|nr:ABC transporter ATP-binding protein [Amycolatopsis tolypomycina]SED27065.1 oligopeptide/dipeptide ABC transporter, ATP-binding protein, C-terminal domain-containing protein [Amycolatopsis tolypomycina]
MTPAPLLTLRNLRVRARGTERTLVRDVSLDVDTAESVALVGESGSGKSMSIKAAMRLLPPGMTAEGHIRFDASNVLELNRRDLARYRARDVALIHQDPRAHINPTRTIAQFVTEGVVCAGQLSEDEAIERACTLMRDVGIDDAPRRMAQFPHQLSGGLLQRVMIVAALLPSPRLIFADEPTTALDVTVQSDVLAILLEQIRDRQLAMLFVTHDLDLAAAVTDRVAVMYAGSIVETGTSAEVCERPLHPYTAGLLASRPSTTEVRRLTAIPGRPVAAYEVGEGCPFAPRCSFATDECRTQRPQQRTVQGRSVACHHAEDIVDRLPERAS